MPVKTTWRVDWLPNPWLSIGLHFDHEAPFIDLHLPGALVRMGRIPDPPTPRRICKRCRGTGVENLTEVSHA